MKLPVTTTRIQVRFSDTDALGHLANESYVNFLTLGRTDFFREIARLSNWRHPFVVANINIDILRESFYGQQIDVVSWGAAVGNKSVKVGQEMLADGKPVCRGVITQVAFDDKARTSMAIPGDWEPSDYPDKGASRLTTKPH